MALFALRDAADGTGLWLAVMLLACPLVVMLALMIVSWIVRDLRDHFNWFRDDRSEGSYLVEVSVVIACFIALVAIGGYFVVLIGPPGP